MVSQATGNGAGAGDTARGSSLFDLRAKQQLNRGYSDGLARGFELVITPMIFGGIGWLLDSWLGTGPILAIAFGVFGVVGIFAKLKLGYDRDMAVAEVGKPWTRGAVGSSLPARDDEAAS
jgi:F0F1-type ATP synthase assembly protein I